MMKKYLLSAVFLVLMSTIPARGQEPLVGLIQGTVIDLKQAPVPYAALTVTNIDSVDSTAHRRMTGADEKGFYQFVDVPMGRYSIVVRKKGYQDYRIPMITVRGGETVNIPEIKMSPAQSR